MAVQKDAGDFSMKVSLAANVPALALQLPLQGCVGMKPERPGRFDRRLRAPKPKVRKSQPDASHEPTKDALSFEGRSRSSEELTPRVLPKTRRWTYRRLAHLEVGIANLTNRWRELATRRFPPNHQRVPALFRRSEGFPRGFNCHFIEIFTLTAIHSNA
jgi:hypothetical protein